MNKFYWSGINANGKRVVGFNEFNNKEELTNTLEKQGITLLSVSRKIKIVFFSQRKITLKHIIIFTRDLTTLVNAGIPLAKGLGILAEGCEIIILKQIINEIKAQIEGGISLARAFQRFSHYFDPIYCGLIHVGERSGTLAIALLQLTNHLEELQQFRNKIKKAMYYPLIVVVISLLITLGLLLFVVPEFQKIFSDFGAPLPLLTRYVINLAEFFQHYGIFLLFLLVIVRMTAKKLFTYSPFIKSRGQLTLLKLPIFGNIKKKTIITRWCQVMATTLQAGIPLLESLSLAMQTLEYLHYKQAMRQLMKEVSSGVSFHKALSQTSLFPMALIHTIAVGENSGSLPLMLTKMAQTLKSELDYTLENLSQLIEPMTMIILAIIIGGIIIALYLPIFKIGTVI